jgi:peptidoglycan hydrolase-like protein with peptidoglycan-binding domain
MNGRICVTLRPNLVMQHKLKKPNMALRRVLSVMLVGAVACLQVGAAPQATKQIKEYQEMLIWTGDYDGMVDGNNGPGTKQAVMSFQKRVGRTETGALSGE